MITLHKLNGTDITINIDLIESIESIPETKISLINGNYFIVKESIDQILDKVICYRAKIELKKEQLKSNLNKT